MSKDKQTQNLMTKHEVAAYLQIAVKTIDQYRKAGYIPYVEISERVIRYDKVAIDEWIAGKSVDIKGED